MNETLLTQNRTKLRPTKEIEMNSLIKFKRGLSLLVSMPPKKSKFNWKDTEKANEIFSEVGGTLGGLERKNLFLKKEIRDDMDGVQGFDRILGQLYKKREFLQKRMDENETYAKAFDEKIGPFEKMYDGLTKDIDVLYRNAKKQHAQGIEVLKQEFDYHPLFKRKNGEFTGVPFKPK